jgi:hypothetical protein
LMSIQDLLMSIQDLLMSIEITQNL